MAQAYSNPERERDPHALPDLEIFELTGHEAAALDEDLVHEYMQRHEFRLASMNSRTREHMLDAIIQEEGIRGGWCYWYCFPGCMPDSDLIGPFDTFAEALADARHQAAS